MSGWCNGDLFQTNGEKVVISFEFAIKMYSKHTVSFRLTSSRDLKNYNAIYTPHRAPI